MSRLFEDFGEDADEGLFSAEHLDDASRTERTTPASALLADVMPPSADTRGPVELVPEVEATAPSRLFGPKLDYEIPDFVRDVKDLESYEDARRRYVRQATTSAEDAVESAFQQKREQLNAELKNARNLDDERRASAIHTSREYANRYPHHVDKRGIHPPSLLETLFSLGGARRLYRAAHRASEALETLRTSMRKKEEQLDQLETQLKRALELKQEAIKKSLENDAGLVEFHTRPEIAPLYARVQQIKAERIEYEKRLERHEVTDAEQRDRAMAEGNIDFVEMPLVGAIVARVARFGSLTYFHLRDLEKRESFLSYDPRLDALRNSVFDVYVIAGTITAKLRRNDNGTAFRVADHFKVCWRNTDKAEELYNQHRAALREQRGLRRMEPRTPTEAEIIERLAALAATLDGGARRDPAPAGVQPAP